MTLLEHLRAELVAYSALGPEDLTWDPVKSERNLRERGFDFGFASLIKAVPPASTEDWERDGYLVSPLPESVATKLERRAKMPRGRDDNETAAE